MPVSVIVNGCTGDRPKSSSEQGLVNVVIEVSEEAFGSPRPQRSPNVPDSLAGYPATGRGGDVDCLVDQLDAGSRIAQPQSREC